MQVTTHFKGNFVVINIVLSKTSFARAIKNMEPEFLCQSFILYIYIYLSPHPTSFSWKIHGQWKRQLLLSLDMNNVSSIFMPNSWLMKETPFTFTSHEKCIHYFHRNSMAHERGNFYFPEAWKIHTIFSWKFHGPKLAHENQFCEIYGHEIIFITSLWDIHGVLTE